MSATLPPGVTIADPPPELKLKSEDGDGYPYGYRNRFHGHRNDDATLTGTTWPLRIIAGSPEARLAKPFGCSGSPDSTRYLEATKFRDMPSMTWDEARAAFNRLLVASPRDHVTLAEFGLTAAAFGPFAGKKGEHAPTLRKERDSAIKGVLHTRLSRALDTSETNAAVLARPIATRLRADHDHWPRNNELRAMVPTAADRWVRIIDATPDQALASLDFLRATIATWNLRRQFAASIAERIKEEFRSSLPTAAEYAEALRIADMLAFTSTRLVALYSGIMHSMPIYRMHPATSEREAIELWWPWGRPVPLVDGGPTRPPPPRKAMLDPTIITATRPTDVVKEVIQQMGINRTTAQRLTANLRRDLRHERRTKALAMLCEGATRAAVAKTVGLSASRISAMFKGQTFPTKKRGRRRAA